MPFIDVSLNSIAVWVRNFSGVKPELKIYINDRDRERVDEVKTYDPNEEFNEKTLYVCELGEILNNKNDILPTNLFCYSDKKSFDISKLKFCNIIISNKPFSPEEITECTFGVGKMINKNMNSYDILEALYSGSDDNICKAGSDITGNPMVIIDENNHILASCSLNSDSEVINIILDPDLGFFEKIRFDQLANKQQGVVNRFRNVNVNYCYTAVEINGLILAYFIVLEDKVKLSSVDFLVLDNLSKAYGVMQLGTIKKIDSARQIYEFFLVKALTDSSDSKLNLSMKQFESIGYTFKKIFSMIVIDSIEPLKDADVKNYMIATAEQLRRIIGGNGLCTPVRDYTLVFLNVNNKEEALIVLEEIKRFCVRNNLRAGISLVFNDIKELKRSHKQALDALTIGSTIEPDNNMLFFDTYRIYRHVLNNANSYDTADLIPECLRKLIEYDHKNNTSFVETLGHYIFTVKSSKKTAELLHIHRNTLLYRLEKIFEIMGNNLDDGNMFAELAIAYKALELFSKSNGEEICFTPFHPKYGELIDY